MYLRTPDDGGSYVAAGDEDEDEGREDENDVSEHFRCDCGIDLDLPRSQTLPVNDAADVVIDFFRYGKRPASVTLE